MRKNDVLERAKSLLKTNKSSVVLKSQESLLSSLSSTTDIHNHCEENSILNNQNPLLGDSVEDLHNYFTQLKSLNPSTPEFLTKPNHQDKIISEDRENNYNQSIIDTSTIVSSILKENQANNNNQNFITKTKEDEEIIVSDLENEISEEDEIISEYESLTIQSSESSRIKEVSNDISDNKTEHSRYSDDFASFHEDSEDEGKTTSVNLESEAMEGSVSINQEAEKDSASTNQESETEKQLRYSDGCYSDNFDSESSSEDEMDKETNPKERGGIKNDEHHHYDCSECKMRTLHNNIHPLSINHFNRLLLNQVNLLQNFVKMVKDVNTTEEIFTNEVS
jgi:hypothetical protein